MRTLATFQSTAFNTTKPKAYFINRGCYGDDARLWLMSRLRAAGVATDPEPGQEDFGWYFNLTVPEGRHCCVLGLRPASDGDPETWITWMERRRAILGSILGGRTRGISSTAVSAIHQALSAPEILGLRCHDKGEFDRGQEQGPLPP
ncbi:MAG TPA: hypothetical protein VKE96_01455 [Vicinamibacterales bacterium]|nr:hypothetical protein [Vicinamibacterales bacterium]